MTKFYRAVARRNPREASQSVRAQTFIFNEWLMLSQGKTAMNAELAARSKRRSLTDISAFLPQHQQVIRR